MKKTQETQEDIREIGNTKVNLRARKWVFTWNNPSEEDKNKIFDYFDKYVIQLEEGTQKTQHLQGFVTKKNAVKFSTLKNKFEKCHWEKCNNEEASIKYCQKMEGRLDGPWIKGYPKPINLIKKFNDFQKKVLKIEQNDRQIHWFVDYEGGCGKTSLAKWMCVKSNTLYLSGKAKDAKYALLQHFKKDETNKDDLTVIFDFARSKDGYVSYQSIEEIKNGIFFNTKYESEMVIFNSPRVIIFSNFYPVVEMLSKDRWVIEEVGDGPLRAP